MRYYLNKLINSLNRFMYGRYKGDELNRFLIIVYFVFYILSFIPIPFFLGFFQLLSTLIFVLILFRALSKNIYSRQQELYKYLNLKNKVKSSINLQKQKQQYRKTHLYFKCRNCKANLRVPKGKGKIEVTCPKCKHTMIKHS